MLCHIFAKAIMKTQLLCRTATCPKAKKVKVYFEVERVAVMNWPPLSPDLYLIENVVNIIGERARKRDPRNFGHLWELLE